MNQENLFSCGSESADLVVASGVLHHSWTAIWDLHNKTNSNEQPSLPFSVKYEVYPQQQPNHNIIAFVTSPTCTRQHLQERELVSSSTLNETFPLFEFLCTKKSPSFSIHKTAITLFASVHDELSKLTSSTPVIITGNSLGGSIASLFTLWLLETMDPKTTKRPLCITFGSPLIGDSGLQKSISQHSTWNSCFIHVASDIDPIPRLLISPHNPSASDPTYYKPFGTFLLCSESGCACFEDSDSILELLKAMDLESVGTHNPSAGWQVSDYTNIVKHLKDKIFVKGISELGERITDPLRAGFLTQLKTMGITSSQQQNNDMHILVDKLEEREKRAVNRKKKFSNLSKKLNDMKIYMACLEWYKKESEAQSFGYYDRYKNSWSTSDIDVSKFKMMLTNYWKDMVAETEKKPQKEGASFRTRWLYAGTNYRRMVEPLDIADHYKKKPGYKNEGRSEHYIKLEQWLQDDERSRNQNNANERKSACSLTEDSCFWAHVEEAILSCNSYNSEDSSPEDKGSSWDKLKEFDRYIMDLIRGYAVSSEIFLEKSSIMQLWKEFEKIAEENSYNLSFIDYMKSGEYRRYA